jgi:hypothetical protein
MRSEARFLRIRGTKSEQKCWPLDARQNSR